MPERFSIVFFLVAAVPLVAPGAVLAEPVQGKVDFKRDIRPFLSGTCLKCHGIDDAARKGKLRLDVREGALKGGKSGDAAVVPGKPEASEAVKRIFSADDDERMPPVGSRLVLTAGQKELFRRWVAEGAEYKTHWAFVPPRRAAVPAVKLAGWGRNGIDAFVLAKLEAEGLAPSAEADRYTLIRRVSLDLVGLPPTVDEADAFAADRSPDAYEKLVERLLASPLYGERWARKWLDLARYADTNGYEKDRARSIWPYRDWVIRALNADMPFDRFTVEQLAGDMLPGATAEQRVATGFHRNTMRNEEGGIDPLEFRFYSVVDRTNVTGTTWLGLTVGCAQCHTHKYDPLPHTSYYALTAFLDNADELDMDLPSAEAAARRAEAEAKVAKMTAELRDRWPAGKGSVEERFAGWEKEQSEKAVRWTVLRPGEMKSSTPSLDLLEDDSVLASGDITKSDTYDLAFKTELTGVTAVRVEALPHASLPKGGPGLVYYEGPTGDFCLSELSMTAGGEKVKFSSGVDSFHAGAFTAEAAIDGNPQTGWMVDGGQGKAHTAVFGLAAPLAGSGELRVRMLFERHFAPALGRFRISVTNDPRAAQAGVQPPAVAAALSVAAAGRTAEQRAVIFDHFLQTAPELAEARKQIDAVRKGVPAAPKTLVMSERPASHARVTHLHKRGEFTQPAEAVAPAVPPFLPPLPTGEPSNRLTFARWLVSRENPLTARVTVNRAWAAFFGRGIVRTVEDFGFQGELPSNQGLLDWLAVEFMEGGWSQKKLHRLIVTSAAYRQSSRVTPELFARDPANVLLARGPRFRAEAEAIRDGALRAAGLLSGKMYGPGVFPPQLPAITTEGAYGPLTWTVSAGEDRYRRSLYTFAKRTAPFAMYTTFDGPTGEACVARREVSDTPLQALTLMNDAMFVEAYQGLGRVIAGMGGTDEERAGVLFRRCLTRVPEKEEVGAITAFVRQQRERLKKKELDAAKVAGAGEGDGVERAAWTAAARAVLNLDEAVTKK